MTTKKLFQDSFVYVFLGFLPVGINFILAPIYSEFIPPEEYGLVALATVFQSALAVAIGLGLDGAFSRLYFDYFEKQKLINALMSTVIISIVIMSAVIGVVLHFFGDAIFSMVLANDQFTYSKYGQLVFFTTFSTVILAVFLSYFRNTENVKIYSVVSLLFFVSSLVGILIGIVYFRAEAYGNIAGKAAGSTLVAVLLIGVFFMRIKWTFKTSYVRNCLTYSLPLIPYLLLLMAYNNIDKYMIEQYFNLESLGLYNFAFLLASAISVLIYSIFNAVSPRIYKLLSIGDKNSIEEVRKINSTFHLVVFGLIVLGIALIIPIIRMFISEDYFSIESYVSILILVYIFQLYYVLFTVPIFFDKNTKVLPWISLGVLIVGIVSNFLLIPSFGIYGVCFALICTKLCQFLFAYFYTYRSHRNLSFLSINKNHILTLSVIIPFGLLFGYNFIFKIIPDVFINIIPLTIYLILIGPLFGSRLKSVVKILLKPE